MLELGLYTFGDIEIGGSAEERMQQMLQEMKLCDELGLDVYGIGEHHRPDFMVSNPSIALAAGAAVTRNIRLTSAVTVLGSEDPVRVYQQFAMIDLISNGRAEIMAGRGSFIESFPLFGQRLEDYDSIFAEKLDLLLKLRSHEKLTWQGKFRPGFTAQKLYPDPVQRQLPIWLAVGGTPDSAVRAGQLGLPLALAIIGGNPFRFLPFFQLYHQAAAEHGNSALAKTSLNMHGFIADSMTEAQEIVFPHHKKVFDRIGAERGWGPQSRAQFDASCRADGNMIIGSPDEVAEKIIALHKVFKMDRLLIKMDTGGVPFDAYLKAIKLFGEVVAPKVRKALAH